MPHRYSTTETGSTGKADTENLQMKIHAKQQLHKYSTTKAETTGKSETEASYMKIRHTKRLLKVVKDELLQELPSKTKKAAHRTQKNKTTYLAL